MTFLSSIDCFNLTLAFVMGPPSHDVFLTVKGVGLTTLSLHIILLTFLFVTNFDTYQSVFNSKRVKCGIYMFF